jgi:hypothetical protein
MYCLVILTNNCCNSSTDDIRNNGVWLCYNEVWDMQKKKQCAAVTVTIQQCNLTYKLHDILIWAYGRMVSGWIVIIYVPCNNNNSYNKDEI